MRYDTSNEAYQAGRNEGFWRWWHIPLAILDLPKKDRTIGQAYRRGIRDGIRQRARSKRLVAQLQAGKVSRNYYRKHRGEILDAITTQASIRDEPDPIELLREIGFRPQELE